MNKVILTGRFTRNPERRLTQSGIEISNFSLACNGDFVDKDGNREVEFVNCVSFQKRAEVINKYCEKGDLIGVQGRIKNESYTDQSGNKRYSTNVIVEQVEFLSSKKKEEGTANSTPVEEKPKELEEDPYASFGEEYTLNADDLPF